LNYHLDTSFLIDWQNENDSVQVLVSGIESGEHNASIDGIAYAEFMAARVLTPRKRLVAASAHRLCDWRGLSDDASRLAAQWLAPMDEVQRRAHFADALIAAIAHSSGVILLTGDGTAARTFPVVSEVYK
jgi:predicted nucleic acid-binding protein